MIYLLTILLQFGAVIGGTSDAEALVWIVTVAEEDREITQTHPLDCRDLRPDDVRITVIQQDDSILFTGCDGVHVYKQGLDGWNHDEGVADLDGKTMIFNEEAVKLVLPNGGEQWVRTVTSLNHVTLVAPDTPYRIYAPDGGIHVVKAWSPEHGELSQVVTVFQGVRVDWRFLNARI